MTGPITLHATAVALDGHAVLIRGASGTGKSALALQLIALGCALVADDQVQLSVSNGVVIASRPKGLPEKIEARGVGLLDAPMAAPTQISLIVDMDAAEADRMPPPRQDALHGIPLTVLQKVDAPHFPAAILIYLRGIQTSL